MYSETLKEKQMMDGCEKLNLTSLGSQQYNTRSDTFVIHVMILYNFRFSTP